MHSTGAKKIYIYRSGAPAQCGLRLGHEVGANAVQAPGQDLAARVRDQQCVFKLRRALPVPRHRSPTVGPGLVLPTT